MHLKIRTIFLRPNKDLKNSDTEYVLEHYEHLSLHEHIRIEDIVEKDTDRKHMKTQCLEAEHTEFEKEDCQEKLQESMKDFISLCLNICSP